MSALGRTSEGCGERDAEHGVPGHAETSTLPCGDVGDVGDATRAKILALPATQAKTLALLLSFDLARASHVGVEGRRIRRGLLLTGRGHA